LFCLNTSPNKTTGFIWTRIKTKQIKPVTRKIVSHFNVIDEQKKTKKFKYIGFFEKNPYPKATHHILELMGPVANKLQYGKYLIERIYYI